MKQKYSSSGTLPLVGARRFPGGTDDSYKHVNNNKIIVEATVQELRGVAAGWS